MYTAPMLANDFMTRAAELVSGDRAEVHGDKHQNFKTIAAYWTAYLANKNGQPLDAADVGYMMALLKIARSQGGKFNPDDAVDGIGYIACAGEIAAKLNQQTRR
jgi:hypothetical protein